MKKSNIFAYIELTKLVGELSSAADSGKLKPKMKAQSAYFNIIEPRYFSDGLVNEWESILSTLKHKGAKTNEEGQVISNAVLNTIDQLTEKECQLILDKITKVYDKVKSEFQ